MEADELALGRVAYEAYSADVGGRSAVSGDELPPWDQQGERLVHAWVAVALAVRAKVLEQM
jgi:hypothetical protein